MITPIDGPEADRLCEEEFQKVKGRMLVPEMESIGIPADVVRTIFEVGFMSGVMVATERASQFVRQFAVTRNN